MQITCYLFDKSVKHAKEAWKDDEHTPPKGYRRITLNESYHPWAEAYLCDNKVSIPPWVKFVTPSCARGELDDVQNVSNSLVIFLKVKQRLFAVCFGYAYTALDLEKTEPDFGLWVAANSIRPDSIRAIQARTIDTTCITRHCVVNRESDIHVFDVDFYLNLLTSLEGCPTDSDLGQRIRGRDACYITKKLSVRELRKLCRDAFSAFQTEKEDSPFQMLRDIRVVRKKKLQAELDGLLVGALRKGDDRSLGLALPDIGDYERIATYEFGTLAKRIKLEDLSIEGVRGWIGKFGGPLTKVLDREFTALDSEGATIATFSLKKAVVFQVTHDGESYVHTLGKWYRVASSFVDRIADDLRSKVRIIPAGTWLPNIHESGKQAEGKYNKRAAKAMKMALLDCNNIQIPSESQIEAADLFTQKKQLVHVKRHTRSATLSHLFGQGTVSARLFKEHAVFREMMQKKLPANMRSLIDPKSDSIDGYSVVYAISAPAGKNLPEDLPFFSRVNLWHHARELERMGYAVELYHIVEE